MGLYIHYHVVEIIATQVFLVSACPFNNAVQVLRGIAIITVNIENVDGGG